MAIIATVGRRSFGAMTLIGSMYFLLTVGGISMVYPFLLMLSTATTTMGDMQEYRVIPRYLYDDNALYRKFLWLRYDTGLGGASARDYNRAYDNANVSSFRQDEYFGWGDPQDGGSIGLARPIGIDAKDPGVRQRAVDLDRFLQESAVLWPGPPLMETRLEDGKPVRRLVTDPHGRPLDPAGLSTGLGNSYRTVGYIGSIFAGLSGPGRDEWPKFLERFYGHPDEPKEGVVKRLERMIARHGRPYERWRQVGPGYDMPTSPSWSINEGEYLQSDWLYYKAVWLGGAPVVDRTAQADAIGIDDRASRTVGQDPAKAQSYTDVLGRTHPWTGALSLRALRPSQVMPEFWKDLQARYMTIEQFNMAVNLARYDWSRQRALRRAADRLARQNSRAAQDALDGYNADQPADRQLTLDHVKTAAGRPRILPTGRDVLLAGRIDLAALGMSPARQGGDAPVLMPEPAWIAAIRAALIGGPGEGSPDDDPAGYRYLLPPRLGDRWAKLTFVFGLDSDRIARLNDGIEAFWLARLSARGYRAVRLEPFAEFNQVYLSSRRPIYEPLAGEWDRFVAGKVPPAMVQPINRDPTVQPPDTGPNESAGQTARPGGEGGAALVFNPADHHLRLPAHAWRDFLSYLYDDGADRQAEFRRLYLAGQSEQQVAQRVRAGRMLYGQEYDQFNLARMPIAERDVVEFEAHKGALRRHFLFGNFRVVLDELVLEGRAMFNTIVLIFLAIATHITVNPLAAYALSRFRLRYTYKVLLFLLATMAFPPAVGMIPGFLLLKHFGLINTYAALVLPGIASGYTIFLLKGFFDALPQELYEAAEIDGAGKISTFLNVTFPLSKPIFAIITLNSFTAAYSGFMWAFLICPDSKMWTIMVHLFNIQQVNTAPIAMAALVLAAIPTFLVFLFCQNVILRGIIIPSFK